MTARRQVLAHAVTATQATVAKLNASQADALSDALLECGATAATIQQSVAEDGREMEHLYAENPRTLWRNSIVVAHFLDEVDAASAVTSAALLAGMDSTPGFELESVRGDGWEDSVRSSYQPLCVVPGVQGRDELWIVPTWASRPPPPAVSLVVEPGVAFGTGEHPTTAMCLAWLWRHNFMKDERVLDYGSGSGVLAIAALMAGARSGVATDIDPVAVSSCATNAGLNGLQERLQCNVCSAIEQDMPIDEGALISGGGQFDVVVANILSGPLKQLAPCLAGHCRPGGRLLLSGVLVGQQAQDVIAAYAPFFENLHVADDSSGWALIYGTRLLDKL